MAARAIDLARAVFAVLPHLGRLCDRATRDAGTLSLDRLKALRILALRGPARAGELADRCLLSAPAATHIVDALVADELVRRDPDPADGRATLIHLTAKGRRARARAEETIVEVLADMLGRLDVDSRGKLLEGLLELERVLREESATLRRRGSTERPSAVHGSFTKRADARTTFPREIS